MTRKKRARRANRLCDLVKEMADARAGKSHSRRKADFACAFKLICPVQSAAQKYSDFHFSEIMISYLHPASIGGAYRDRHGTWEAGGDGRIGSQRG
ncbi:MULTISPECIES: hypothetical protein [unclassified Bradyrhizobium]|nr:MULTISPECIES: hypothetical protein [unclassified Bradyrhizobium]